MIRHRGWLNENERLPKGLCGDFWVHAASLYVAIIAPRDEPDAHQGSNCRSIPIVFSTRLVTRSGDAYVPAALPLDNLRWFFSDSL